ncbi:MAG: hypothetical protein R2856_34140 [Caldilineaceae bacterium]
MVQFPGFDEAALLVGWLAQDDRTIARVLARACISHAMGVALGWQALLNHPLRGDEVLAAHRSWPQRPKPICHPAAIVQLNIGSLAATSAQIRFSTRWHRSHLAAATRQQWTIPAQARQRRRDKRRRHRSARRPTRLARRVDSLALRPPRSHRRTACPDVGLHAGASTQRTTADSADLHPT